MMQWLLPTLVALAAVIVLFYVICRWRRMEACTVLPLRKRLEKQEQELRRVRDLEDARNLFLAGLSHELRTPLSGIAGALRLLQATGLNTRQREYVRMSMHANVTVLEIVDDMLTFSRIQADKLQIEMAGFSLRAVVDDMLSLQSIKAQSRHLALVRDIAADVPDALIGDSAKLKQILLNLLSNAIKFTDEGSVCLSVAVVQEAQDGQPVAAESGRSGKTADAGAVKLAFTVSDTGIGIAPDQLEKVFEPFVQAGPDAGRGGTGLGLAICRRLVHSLGGELRLDSQPGAGVVARFDLLFELARDLPVKPDSQPTAWQTSAGASLMVLVIEDDEINRLVCTRYLALSGHHPLAVAEPRQVFHLAEHASRAPDAILLDMHLSGQSGTALLARLHDGWPNWRQVPVVAMSADVSGAAQDAARMGGVEVFLAKPFTASQLDAALGAVVSGPVMREPAPRAAQSLLDLAFLEEERAGLGQDVMLELLNIFRAGAASRLAAMTQAVERQDWQAAGAEAHALQGSAANLGMTRVRRRARALWETVMREDDCMPAPLLAAVHELELVVHDSADALRAFLLAAAQEEIALAADGDD